MCISNIEIVRATITSVVITINHNDSDHNTNNTKHSINNTYATNDDSNKHVGMHDAGVMLVFMILVAVLLLAAMT